MTSGPTRSGLSAISAASTALRITPNLIDAARAQTAIIAARRATPPPPPEPHYLVGTFGLDSSEIMRLADWLNQHAANYSPMHQIAIVDTDGITPTIVVTLQRIIPFDRAED